MEEIHFLKYIGGDESILTGLLQHLHVTCSAYHLQQLQQHQSPPAKKEHGSPPYPPPLISYACPRALLQIIMDGNPHPKRAFLHGERMAEMFDIMCKDASSKQWAEWLRAPLEHAAVRGNKDLVETLISAGANGSSVGPKASGGRSLLDAAVQGGSEEVISALLLAGSGPDVKVTSGRSPLYASIVAGRLAVARKLLAAGADVDYLDPIDRRYPLHAAVLEEHLGLVNDLLIAGANPNAGDVFGKTPLHFAASGGHEQIASALLCNGRTDKDALDHVYDTPLILAVKHGHISIVKVLLVGGATLKSVVDAFQEEALTALEVAARMGKTNVIKAFLQHEPSVSAHTDDSGFSPLFAAAVFDQEGSVDVLVDGGFDVNAKLINDGKTPLHLAAQNGCHRVIPALLHRGADPTKTSWDGETPLHAVCVRQKAGVAAAVDLLLRRGASESALDGDGETPAQALEHLHAPGDFCSPDELQLVRDLLANAPADRVWRRRCWLIMLRARAEREAVARSTDVNGVNGEAEEAGGVSKAARKDGGAGGIAAHGCRSCGGGEGSTTAGAAANESFGGLVAVLVGMKARDVFRTVVSFL